MPVDVILLLDVSASMEPHIARISAAAHEALSVLGEQDRVGIMVFDRQTRTRLPLRRNRADVETELERLLKHEGFNGGTDITRGLLDAAAYMGREGRHDARRAIVIVTDDQTERERDEARVGRALAKADAVLMAILAPDAMHGRVMGRHGGGYPGGSTWPGGGGGGWPGGGGGGWPGGGGGWPGGGGGGGPEADAAIQAVEAGTVTARTRNRRARRRSPRLQAATAPLSTKHRHSKTCWNGSGSATRCISACPKASSPARNGRSKCSWRRRPTAISRSRGAISPGLPDSRRIV